MKLKKVLYIPILSSMVLMPACKQKDGEAASGESASIEDKVVDAVKQVVSPGRSAEERAAKLGFAKNLPADIEYYSSVQNGAELFAAFQSSAMGQLLIERMEAEGMTFEDVLGSPEMKSQLAPYAEDYFQAYGKGGGKAAGHAVDFITQLAYYGTNASIYTIDAQQRDGDGFADDYLTFVSGLMDGPLKGFPKELVGLFGEFEMPAYYQGYKISNAEDRAANKDELDVMYAMMFGYTEEMGISESIQFTRQGAEFTGYKINGAGIAALINEENVGEGYGIMSEMLGAENLENFKSSMAEKTLVLATAEVGDYVVIFIGSNEDQCVFVDKPSDSIVASDKIAFVDDYLDKKLVSVALAEKEMMQAAGSYGSLFQQLLNAGFKGLKEGVENATALGDTQDVTVLLDSLQKQGEALQAMYKPEGMGMVCWFDSGLHAEMFGGSNAPAVNFSKTHSLSELGAGENILFFANQMNNKDYSQKALEYFETIGATSYVLTNRLSAMDIDDPEFEQFKMMFQMFDGSFKADLLGLWTALSGDLAGGLGDESAVVIDTAGSLPTVPMIPQVLVDEAKVPRLAYVSTVEDRSKLQSSWEKVNASTQNLLKSVGAMTGMEIPMQKPMSSQMNGLTSWSFAIPGAHDNANLTVSVSDTVFISSTSKQFAEQLNEISMKKQSATVSGSYMKLDFKVAHKLATDWFALIEKNADAVMGSESAKEDFLANKGEIQKVLDAMAELDELTVHIREEDGETRTSVSLSAK